jgi:hypothetical protein
MCLVWWRVALNSARREGLPSTGHGGLTFYNLGVPVQILYALVLSESYMCRYVRRK